MYCLIFNSRKLTNLSFSRQSILSRLRVLRVSWLDGLSNTYYYWKIANERKTHYQESNIVADKVKYLVYIV